MTTRNTRIAIIGGGLSGLYAAALLDQRGLTDWALIEARETLGGRIVSTPVLPVAIQGQAETTARHDRVDLGASWFWPACQPQLDRVVHDLGIERFAQHAEGDMLVERSAHAAPARTRGHESVPPSMRLLGGMGSLIDALRSRLDVARLSSGVTAQKLRHTPAGVELLCVDIRGQAHAWRAQHVLLALPPRLAIHSIDWEPRLPPLLAERWRATDTWMAPHAKYVAVYDRPFWRLHGLSGEARSFQGPLAEIHDASMPGGSAALFGFLGVPAGLRQGVAEDVLRAHCRAQLARLFGPEASTPRAEFLKDWAFDPCTAAAAEGESLGQHPEAPPAAVPSGPWAGRLTGIGSEWSRDFPGYVAGAIEAASAGVDALAPRG
jgi:monoamine oxidase